MKLKKSNLDRATYQGVMQGILDRGLQAGRISEEDYEKRFEHLAAVIAGGDDPPPADRAVLWDDEVKGLGLRVFPSGTKTFVLSFRVAGRKRLMKLGRYGRVLTLDQARKKAGRELRKVDDSLDPLKTRQEERLKSNGAKTVANLCDAFIERHAKVAKKTWQTDQGRIDKYIKPMLGNIRVEEVSRERVGQFYREIGSEKPYEANRLIALLSAMFNRAPLWGFLPEGAPNPAKMTADSMYREVRRERPVKTEELPRLLDAIEAETDVYARSAFKLLLLTGLRKRELLRAKWDDLDLGRGTLRLEDTKAGQPRQVPLSTAALEILKALPRMVGNPHLFPSQAKPGQPLYDLRRPWKRVREAAGCSDLTIHDLRHSLATWLAEDGQPAQTIQQALGHRNIEQTMGYVHAGDKSARQALERLAQQILSTD